MDTPNQLTRICSSCGMQKPLSAFLQLGGDQGSTYGIICSDCRRASIDSKQSNLNKDHSESTTTTTGLRIDAKAKFTADMEKRRLAQAIKEQTKEELKKRDSLKTEKEILKERKEKAESEHRKFYLETKKTSFISDSRKKSSTAKQTTATKKILADKTTVVPEGKATHSQEKKLDDLIEQELQLTTINLTNQFIDPQFAEVRHQSSLFAQFKQWLGAASPLGKANAIKAIEQLQKTQAKKNISDKNLFNKKVEVEKKDPLSEYIDKTWGPSSKRGK